MLNHKPGDIVRNRKPYWGEPAYKYLRDDNLKGWVVGQSVGGKFGSLGISCKQKRDLDYYYVPCPLYMTVWLMLMGFIADIIAFFKWKWRNLINLKSHQDFTFFKRERTKDEGQSKIRAQAQG